MSGPHPSNSTTLRRRLLVVALVASVLLTALAVYDIISDDYGVSVWFAIICWPVVAIANCVQLYRIRRAP